MRLKSVFSDADIFCAAGAGWDVEFRQLDAGPLTAALEVVAASGVAAQRIHLNRRFHQQGCPPKGMLTFGIPDPSKILSWNSSPLSRPKLLNFNSRNGYDSVSEAGFSGKTFSIAEEVFQDAATILGFDIDTERFADAADRISVSFIDRDRITEAADKLFNESQFGSAEAEFANIELQDELVLAIVTAASDSVAAQHKVHYSQRQKAVNRALDYIRSVRQPVPVRDLYKVSSCSERTLDRGFQERFGVSPKKYMVAMRMIGARRALQLSPPESRVADIANEWGFWHPGRFSVEYRRMFGERPTDSLKP